MFQAALQMPLSQDATQHLRLKKMNITLSGGGGSNRSTYLPFNLMPEKNITLSGGIICYKKNILKRQDAG